MKPIIHLLVCGFMLVLSTTWAAAVEATPSLSLRVLSPHVGTCDPVGIIITITNTSPWPVQDVGEFCDGYGVSLRYRREGTEKWSTIGDVRWYTRRGPILAMRELAKPPHPMASHEGEDLTMWVTYNVVDTLRLGTPVFFFDSPSDYSIEALYRLSSGEKLRSASVKFSVEEYRGIDADAHRFLAERGATHFLYERFQWRNIIPESQGKQIANEVLTRYASSRFAPWARLYLLRHQAATLNSVEACVNARTEAQRVIETGIPVLSDEAITLQMKAERRLTRLTAEATEE